MSSITHIPEFGVKRENEERRDGGCGVVFSPQSQKYAVGKQTKNNHLRLFSGGVDTNEDTQTGVLREVTEESGLYDFLYIEKIAEAWTHYYNSLKQVNRFALATCYLVILNTDKVQPTHLEAHETFVLEWATAKELLENWKARNDQKDYDHWIYFFNKAVSRAIELGYDTSNKLRTDIN